MRFQIFTLITNAFFFAMVHHGFGRHSDVLAYEDVKQSLFYWWINQQAYKVALHMTKISLLLLYMRIFNHVAWFRKVAIGIIVFLVLYTIGSCGAGFAQCTPIEKSWDKTVDGKCVNLYVLFTTNGAVAMVSDAVILVLPLPLIYSLTLPWAQKLALIPVFGLGLVICLASVLRVHFLITTPPSADRSFYIASTMWTILEYNLAMVCLCLPSVRVLLVRGFPRYFKSAASRGSNARSAGLNAGVKTWPSATARNNDTGNWTRADGEPDRIGRHRKSHTESQEIILAEEVSDVERGTTGPAGIKKTVEYEVEFEMLESSKSRGKQSVNKA